MAKLLKCFDSVTWEAVPTGDLALGYVDGEYQTWGPLNEKFKGKPTKVLSVTVDVKPGADIADCELGNAGPVPVAAWAYAELKAHRTPTIYGSYDYLVECAIELRKLKVNARAVDWFLADYVQVTPAFNEIQWKRKLPVIDLDGTSVLCSAWQFADSIRLLGHTIDASLVSMAYARKHGWNSVRVNLSHGAVVDNSTVLFVQSVIKAHEKP